MAVDYKTDGPVAVVTLDRGDVANAIDRPTADELVAALPPARRRRCAATASPPTSSGRCRWTKR